MQNIFRVFDRACKEMHIVGEDQHDSMFIDSDNVVRYHNYQNGECSIDLEDTGTEDDDGSGYILMRYTGMSDKNSKKIFEFDECEVTRHCIWVTGFIKFHQGCFIFQEYKTGNILRLCDIELNGYTIKITGLAIYNPELLQEEDK